MINEDRVKELYAISTYEKYDEPSNRQAGQYYRSDYIWKEMIKSFFAGTIAFGLLLVLWGMNHSKELSKIMMGDTLATLIITVGLCYVVFMILYFLITFLVYFSKYRSGRKKLKKYCEHLKTAEQMYNREEKLKN